MDDSVRRSDTGIIQYIDCGVAVAGNLFVVGLVKERHE